MENGPPDHAGRIGAEDMDAQENDLSNEAAALADILKWWGLLPDGAKSYAKLFSATCTPL